MEIDTMALQTRLIGFVHRVATGSRKVRNLFTPVGALIFGLLVCGVVVAGLHVDRLLGIEQMLPAFIRIILSLPIFAIAVLLIGWSVRHFLMAKGTPVPLNPPPRLVATGPYAFSRNPMLTGIFALLFAIGVLLGSVFLLLVFTPLFIALNYWELKWIEEPELEKRLGRAYVEYRANTPMFLPDLKRILKKERR
jgi:protein-S-isoprenylcysteine O-methyltransferase Ste14